MTLFARSLAAILFLVLFSMRFTHVAFASTTPFRSARIVTTDGDIPFTNLGNCTATDGVTCDRATGRLHANLYLQEFGTYEDFGMPQGSVISAVRIRVTGKASTGIYVGVSTGTTYTMNCQFPSDRWTLWGLMGQTINVQTFVTSTSVGSLAYCFGPAAFQNQYYNWRINYSSGQSWTANIDNVEIAFDYDPAPPPTPTLTPTPTATPSPTPAPSKTPLILIPGIGGSELETTEAVDWSQPDGHGGTFTHTYPANEKVWVNAGEAVRPGEDDYFDILRLQSDGQTGEANLGLTGNLYELYQETIDFFVSDGYMLNRDLFVFPYDWRKDIALTASLLDEKIESVTQQTGSPQVDIIAHSMGGLVARNYIAEEGRARKVKKLLILGTPYLGAVDATKKLLYGGCLTKPGVPTRPLCIGLAPSETKDVLQNMLSLFQILPSQRYFEFYSGQDSLHPFPFRDDRDMDGNGVVGPLDYDQTKTLLSNLGHNTSLFGPSEAFHNLDNNLITTNGVEVTNIVGSGMPTLGQIIEKNSIDFFGVKIPHRDEVSVNGDQTVPLFSASLVDSGRNISLLGDAKVFYTKLGHENLVSSGPALNLVKNILNNSSQLPIGISTDAYLFSGTEVSVHSPVAMHVFDASGNHTGPTVDGNFEANIPGSSYDTLDDATFIWLPDDGQYRIELEATGQGNFDFKIREFENDTATSTAFYNDVLLTASTKAHTMLDTSSIQPPTLQIDQDGNGTTDESVAPTSILTGDAGFDATPPNTVIELSGTPGDNGWYRSDVTVTLTAQDEAGGSGVHTTEYSLDNGPTVQAYTGPFTISHDEVMSILFRSRDNAGNEETPHEAEIKIDKTPPEANIFVDQDQQDVVVSGVDANETTVARSDNAATRKQYDAFYHITDIAGNSLWLDVRDRDKDKKDRLGIFSLTYNDGPPMMLPDNHYIVSYQGKKDRLNVKEQRFELNKEVKIRIKYDSKTDKSTVVIREFGSEKVKEVRDGLVLLRLLTNGGNLEAEY